MADKTLRWRGFPGEGIRNRNMLVVKTHSFNGDSRRTTIFDRAILLVRNPFRAIQVWHGVAWRGVEWRGVEWRGVAWCGVACCGVVGV